MRAGFFILSSLLVLAPVVAQFYTDPYDPGEYLSDAANFVEEFVFSFGPELASLSIAAVAAVGVMIGLKRSKMAGFDDRSLNILVVVVFIAMFLMVYSSRLYIYFVPFLGYLVIAGLGMLIWGIYDGLHKSNIEPFDKIIAAAGCFFLSWFALMSGLLWVSIGLSVVGIVLLLAALPAFRDLLGKIGLGGRSASRASKKDDEEISESEAIKSDEGYDESLKKAKELLTELIASMKEGGDELFKALEYVKGGLEK